MRIHQDKKKSISIYNNSSKIVQHGKYVKLIKIVFTLPNYLKQRKNQKNSNGI